MERRARTFERHGVRGLVILCGRGQRADDHRHAPRTQFGGAHHSTPHEGHVARGVGIGNRREIGHHLHIGAIILAVCVVLRLAGGPDDAELLGKSTFHPCGHRLIERTRPLAPAKHEEHARVRGKPPACPRGGAVGTNVRRGLYRISRIAIPATAPGEIRFGFWKSEIGLRGDAAKHARRQPRMTVANVLHDRHTARPRPGERGGAGVAAGANHDARRECTPQCTHGTPRARRAAYRAPVPPQLRPVERMQIKERVRELCLRKDVALNAALRADKVRHHRRVESDQCPRNREPRIQMSAGAATGDDHVHRPPPNGSDARSPITRSG